MFGCFVFAFLLSAVAASLHDIAVHAVSKQKLCMCDALVPFVEKHILNIADVDSFNETMARTVSSFRENALPDVVMESVFVFLQDPQSPLCQYIIENNPQLEYYNLHSFSQDIGIAFRDHILLHSLTKTVFSLQDDIFKYELKDRTVKLTKLFVHYCKHKISTKMLFTAILKKFVDSDLELYSCPQLNSRLNEIFASPDYRARIETFKDHFEPLNDFLCNYIFRDIELMNNVFDHLVAPKRVNLKLKLIGYMFTYQRPIFWLPLQKVFFCNAMISHDFKIDRIMQFMSRVIDVASPIEWEDFIRVYTFPGAMRTITGLYEYDLEALETSIERYCRFLSQLLANPDDQIAATNLIVHLRRANVIYFYNVPAKAVETISPPERWIARVATAYEIDLSTIDQEFPSDLKINKDTYYVQHNYFEKTQELINKTEWE